MTAAQLYDARMLIPGAFELNAPPHRAIRDPRVPPPASQDVGPSPSLASTSQVESAPPGPTTRFGYAAAILKDVALLVGLIYGVAVVPALVLWAIHAAASFVRTP